MSSISGLGSSAASDASLNQLPVSQSSSSSTLVTATSSSTTITISDSINLNADYIQTVDNSVGNISDASNIGSLFYVLSENIQSNDPTLVGVGSAIDTFTKSLPSSTLYDSSYTAPSARFLGDLANLKTVAASGDLAAAKSDLAQATIDAPQSVADGDADALGVGDTSGEVSLAIEGTANVSRDLVTQGYSAAGAEVESIALTINGLAEYATNTPTSSAQTRFQQISFLATYAAEHGGTTQAAATANASNPLFNIISTLQDSTSGSGIDQSLTNLVALYSGGTSTIAESSTSTTTDQTTTLIEYLNDDQQSTASPSASASSTQKLLREIEELFAKAVKTFLDSSLGISKDQSLANLGATSEGGTSIILTSSTLTVQTSSSEYLSIGQVPNQNSTSPGLSVNA